MSEAEIRAFLSKEVPPGGTRDWVDWQVQSLGLGDDAPDVFFKVLKDGDECQRYAALLSLRVHGFVAYGHGDKKITGYFARKGDLNVWVTPES